MSIKEITNTEQLNTKQGPKSAEQKPVVEVYLNKPINKPNFVFDDKGGKFYMYSSIVERFTDKNKIEVYSHQNEQGKPEILEVKTTLLEDGAFAKCSPKGSKAFVKMNYNKTAPNDLFYIVDNLLNMTEGYRIMQKLKGDDIYVILNNEGNYTFVTKEQYENPNFDVEKK